MTSMTTKIAEFSVRTSLHSCLMTHFASNKITHAKNRSKGSEKTTFSYENRKKPIYSNFRNVPHRLLGTHLSCRCRSISILPNPHYITPYFSFCRLVSSEHLHGHNLKFRNLTTIRHLVFSRVLRDFTPRFVGPSIRPLHFTFLFFLRSLASLILPK